MSISAPILMRLFLSFIFLLINVCLASATPPITKEQIFQFGTLAAREGQYQESIDLFKKVIEIDPRFTAAYNSIGLVYQAMEGDEKSEEAVRYFKMALDLDPDYLECLNNLGRAYYAQGLFVQAEKVLLRSLEIKPQQADIQLVLGWVYLIGQSRAEKAASFFETGLAGKDDTMGHYGLGLSYMLLGEKFKVLDKITELRRRGEEDRAGRLEAMIRGDIKVTSKPGSPLITGQDTGPSVFDQQMDALSGRQIDADEKKEGIQVRLKGPINY